MLRWPRPSLSLALQLVAGQSVAVALWCSAELSRAQWCSAGLSGAQQDSAVLARQQRGAENGRGGCDIPGTSLLPGPMSILVLLASPYLHGCCGFWAEPCPFVQPVNSAGCGPGLGARFMLKEVQPPLRVLGQPLCPHGMGDSWHLSFHSQPVSASSGVPSALCMMLSSEDPKMALPHAGAMVWSELLPQTRANPSSSRAGCSPPAQAAWPRVPHSSLAGTLLPPPCAEKLQTEREGCNWSRDMERG